MRVTLKNGVVLEFDSTGMVEESGGEDCKDCKTCKCNKDVGDIGLCMIPEVEKALEGEK